MHATIECARMRPEESAACARLLSASFGLAGRVTPSGTLVAREGDVVRGLVCVRNRRAGFGGRFVGAACLSSLCVDEAERSRGIGSALVTSALHAAFERGIGAALLIPRSEPLYARLGFAVCGRRSTCEVELPRTALAPRAFTHADEPAWRELAEHAALERTAVVVPSLADRARRARAPRRTLVVDRDGAPAAFLTVSERADAHGATLYVHELLARDPEAAGTVWAAIAASASRARRVRCRLAQHDPLAELAHAEGARFTDRGPWMLRLVDARRFLSTRGFARGTAELSFALRDELISANERPFVLSIANGRGRVREGGRASIRADVASFALLCAGAASASALSASGGLEAPTTELERLDTLFTLSPPMLQSLP